MSQHEKYMHRCLELSVKGLGKVAPNPMVGCIITGEDGIAGEGYHEMYGQAHAEINALNSVKYPASLKKATLYVNLEPCAHQGKTGPCTDAIIASGIKKVVVGCTDPNPQVKGKGIEQLVRNGIDVITGVLEKECIDVNKRFFTFYEKNRPYVILKWAQTSDGLIDRKRTAQETPAKITRGEADMMVHLWRSQEQAIMVGTQTVIMDNPNLTVRKVAGASPTRVVLDRTMKIPENYHVYDNAAKTIVFTEQKINNNHGAEYIPLNFDDELLKNILKELYQKNIQSVIIEGGEKLLNSFITKDLWDEAKVFYSSETLKEGVPAPHFPFPSKGEIRMGDIMLALYRNKHK